MVHISVKKRVHLVIDVKLKETFAKQYLFISSYCSFCLMMTLGHKFMTDLTSL